MNQPSIQVAAAAVVQAALSIDESLLPENPTGEQRARLGQLRAAADERKAQATRRDEYAAFNATLENRQIRRAKAKR